MHPFAHKTAVITGAASGIGRALAQELARVGCHLALADIDLEGLRETRREIAQPTLRISLRQLDVADRAAVYAFAEETLREHGAVDIVINNAGVAATAPIEALSYEDFDWLMGINFWGMVYGSKAFLPHLKTRPEAWLVNVSSIYGILTVPTQGAYHSAKFAIRGFTECLRQEMHHTPVHVVSVHPGGVRTNIVRNMRFDAATTDKTESVRNFDQIAARTSPEKAARVLVEGMRKRKKRILIGKDAWLMDKLHRIFPTGYEKLTQRRYRP